MAVNAGSHQNQARRHGKKVQGDLSKVSAAMI
jgi:hypothetical protein